MCYYCGVEVESLQALEDHKEACPFKVTSSLVSLSFFCWRMGYIMIDYCLLSITAKHLLIRESLKFFYLGKALIHSIIY